MLPVLSLGTCENTLLDDGWRGVDDVTLVCVAVVMVFESVMGVGRVIDVGR